MVKVYTVNAFTKTRKGGNPAGVCLNADVLTDRQMQSIAKKVGFSETAFVSRSDSADLRVRFFTVEREVDLCGHAAIATFYLLYERGILKPGNYKQETKAGILPMEIGSDGSIFMDQNPPRFLGTVSKDQMAQAFGITMANIVSFLPIEILSTGFPCILVPLTSLLTLHELKPDFEKIAAMSQMNLRALVYAFSLETLDSDFIAHARMFDPLDGINEEAATGTAAGALASYLFRHHLIEGLSSMRFEQGHAIERPSEILARLIVQHDQIARVIVGGNAVVTGEMTIPLAD